MIFIKSYIYDRNTLLLLYILFITNIYEKYDIQKCLIIVGLSIILDTIIKKFDRRKPFEGTHRTVVCST